MGSRETVRDALKKYSVSFAQPGQEFTLASGEKSNVYVDVKKTAMHHSIHHALAMLLYESIQDIPFLGVDTVAGVVVGGCHLASLVGLYSAMLGRPGVVPFDVVYVRKEAKDHGTKNLVEFPATMVHDAPRRRALLIEDVVTTGGSTMKAAAQLRALRYEVPGVLAVIDRRVVRKPRLDDGTAVRALFTLDEFNV